MEAPMRHTPAPPRQQQDAIAAAALQHVMAPNTPPAMAMAGREQCPRCASRDTKFCYYNNYNTAQPRHFCRACRRYWTLGGSLRNVPVGGSTRKRQRPARPTRRALAAAVATTAAATMTTTATASSCGSFSNPVVAPAPASGPALSAGLLSSLILGSASSPLLALGAAPFLEGRLNFDLGLRQPAGAGDLAQLMGFATVPPPWPVTTILEGDRAEPTPWKAGGGMFPPALWQEELAAGMAPTDHAGGLLLPHQPHHGAPPVLL
ncbi:hypothetical protein EJB05_00689, partial [Eragrostis curvula]